MVSYSPRLKDRSMYGVEMSAFKWPCVVCRQVDVSPNSWRETWWCSSTVETFPNTHTTRLSCSYEPAESRTPESWPCWSDVKVCVCDLNVHTDCHVYMNIYHSLEPSLSRSRPGGTPAAVTSRPHSHQPITGRQAAVIWPVGAGHDTGGVNETSGERNTVWHTLLPFWGIFKMQVGAKQWMGNLKVYL